MTDSCSPFAKSTITHTHTVEQILLHKYYQDELKKSSLNKENFILHIHEVFHLQSDSEERAFCKYMSPKFDYELHLDEEKEKKRKLDQIQAELMTRRQKRKPNVESDTDSSDSSDGEDVYVHKRSTKTLSDQVTCCLKGCDHPVTNRLRFSLRTHSGDDFRREHLEIGWDKVCHYHYFADLYKYKKQINGTTSKPLPKVQKKTPSESLGEQRKNTYIMAPLM